MAMQMDPGTVPGWFKDLPLTDPRCNNDSCAAFNSSHRASREQISYASQFLYGHWVAVYYCGWILLASFVYALSRMQDKCPRPLAAGGPNAWQKAKAVVRFVSYRRLSSPLGDSDAPSVGVLTILVAGTVTTMAMAFLQRPYYRSRRAFGSPPLAVRTGLMSAALIPLTVALAGKVNIISMMTGLGHEKLNIFHRIAGALMFVLSTIHTIPFFVSLQREGGYAAVRDKYYSKGSLEFNGTPGYAFAFALVALSVPYIRRQMYELFVWSHIIFAIIFFALMFWHFGNIGDSWVYLWATLAIWLVQILVRTFWRMSIFNLRGTWFDGCRATISKSADGTMRVNVAVPEHYRWRPGQHMYLRFPYLNVFDNHPFTIASICKPPNSDDGFVVSTQQSMLFLIRPYDGATRQLLKFVEENPKMKISAAIDGPYGTQLRRFEHTADKVLLVAGGTGVSAILPILTDMSLKLADPACMTRKVQFVWMIRHANAMEWILRELTAAIQTALADSLEIVIYVTEDKRHDSTATTEIEEEKEEADSAASSFEDIDGLPNVHLHYGHRPDLLETLPSWLGTERTAIVGCGPTSLRNNLSNACARAQKLVLQGSAHEIHLHTESFDW